MYLIYTLYTHTIIFSNYVLGSAKNASDFKKKTEFNNTVEFLFVPLFGRLSFVDHHDIYN